MFKKIFWAIYRAPNHLIYLLIKFAVACVYFVRRRYVWIAHALVFIYAYKHIHLFKSTIEFQLLIPQERRKQEIALLLLILLLCYWVWQGVKAIQKKPEEVTDLGDAMGASELHSSDQLKGTTQPTYSMDSDSAQKARLTIVELEKRMGYQAKPLTAEQQDMLNTEIHNYARTRRLPE